MKQARFELRLTEEELKGWRAKAAEAGMLLASWIRERCNAVEGEAIPEGSKPEKAVIPPRTTKFKLGNEGVTATISAYEDRGGYKWTPPAHAKTCQCQVCKFKREVGK